MLSFINLLNRHNNLLNNMICGQWIVTDDWLNNEHIPQYTYSLITSDKQNVTVASVSTQGYYRIAEETFSSS